MITYTFRLQPVFVFILKILICRKNRVGIKPGFYHKAQPGGFYEGGFLGVYVGFINLKVYHNSHNQLLPYSFSVLTVLV